VHRDLKPANILIGAGGEVKIADFGIALEGRGDGLTRPGTLVGSIPYMSPEQMLGERVDYRSDLFSFGVLLYELVAGVAPFPESEENPTETLLERIRRGRFDSPRKHARGVPLGLVRLIRSCLRGKPAHRVQTATEIRRRLERRLGAPSPADCRREIALFLAREGFVGASDGSTAVRVAARRRLGGKLRWLLPASAALVLFVTAGVQLSGFTAEPAQVRIVAYPWAEVRLDDSVAFHTPQAAPVTLEPGPHRIVFEHPRYGKVEYTVDLAAGETRMIRHVFEEARR